jgi:signal transduction histidine kinase/membrane associated rhomboid family serine protease
MSRRAAALAWAICAVMAVPSTVLLVLGPGRPVPDDLFGGVGGAAFLVMSLAFATTGAIVASRVTENRIGWLFCVIGLLAGATILAYEYANYGLHAASEPLSGARAAAWLSIGPSEVVAGLLALALLLFPDGRLPSRRWWPAAAMLLLGIALVLVGASLRPGPLDNPFATVSNPLGLAGARSLMDAVDIVGWVLVVVGIALGAASLLIRLRRARGIERQQLKLVLAVGTLVAAVTTVVMTTWFVWPEGNRQLRMAAIGLSFAAFPAAAGLAILRYRLYDVDVVINRALVYGALTALLAAAYAATALLLGTAVGRGSAWATAGATLAVAAAFRPLRARVQDAVDRRFNRARYDALHRIRDFLEELRAGRAAPEEIEGLLQELVSDPQLELRFALPDSALYVDTRGIPAAELRDDTRHQTPIERAGVPIGLILHEAASQNQRDLLPRLVEAGALAIEITRLRVELRRQLAEVEASRARIVAAGDEERRRIERNLHDGAQQRLVSIGLALRHAQHELASGAGGQVPRTLDAAVAELAVAVGELRELARGLPPPQLDAGLAPALRELAGRAALPVEVRATSAKLPAGVEAAAYFIACEGLTNAVKHANASKVVLSAAKANGMLVMSVADDGVGGAAEAGGSGLRGLADRIAAQGGTLDIRSEPGAGTTLTAELPCGS